MAEDSVWEQRSKTVSHSIRELTSEGVTLEFNYRGETSGKLKAQTMGTTTVWSKPDGNWTWEDKMMGTTEAGEMFACWGKGSGTMSGPGAQSWEGEVEVMSQSPGLSWLHKAKFRATGSADPVTGESRVKYHRRR